MPKVWSFFISLMLLLTLGMAQAPSPCLGDGHGGSCRVAACNCIAGCSCHTDHDREHPLTAPASSCCHLATCKVCEQRKAKLAMGCHRAGQFPNFAPALKRWTAALPALPAITLTACPSAPMAGTIEDSLGRPLAPPEKPPRPLVIAA